jgi:hypothetical protein
LKLTPAAARVSGGCSALAAGILTVSLTGIGATAFAKDICDACIELRIEYPHVVRGPSRHEPDAPVSLIELPDGHFRAFAANGTTVAIDGATPFDLGGRSKAVLEPGPPGSAAECGRWLTSVLQGGGMLYGLIHNEQHCNYRRGETDKSMSVARSADHGLSWDVLGQIIRSNEAPASGRAVGEGDCTMADGHDGFWYAYCQRLSDWKNFVARAASGDPAPGKWMKWSGSGWNSPGLGGSAAPLDSSIGMSAAYWTDANAMLVLAAASSLRLSISTDKIHFATLAEPIILYDGNEWERPAPTDLYAYPSMIGEHGFSDIGGHFFLTYTYLPPGADFTQRYLVMHEARIELASAPRHPQVRVALSRWKDDEGLTWATTGPPIFAGTSFTYDLPLGYVMTAPPQLIPSVKLDECFSPRFGGFLTEAGGCAKEGSERRRVAGYVFRSEQPGTTALYSCLSARYLRFTSDRPDCDGAGTRDRVLGYALRG